MNTVIADSGNDILGRQEAAQLIGMSVRFLDQKIKEGSIRAFKPSRKITRILRRDLVAWLEKFSTVAE